MEISKKSLQDLSYVIIGCAIEVHKELGPGLTENVYDKCFCYELEHNGLRVTNQVSIPVKYKEVFLNAELRFDILVNDQIIIELKAVDFMFPVYDAQLLTYMKLLQKPKGLLINFNTRNIASEGIKSMVNHYFSVLPEG
jgi:GxxExxY protein